MHKKCKTTRKYKYRYHSKSGERLRAVALVEEKNKKTKISHSGFQRRWWKGTKCKQYKTQIFSESGICTV